MSRSVPEWRGANDDVPVPARVRLRVFLSKDGRCHRCNRKITTGESWTCEHLVAVVNGGENRERNLDVTCDWCLPAKNAEDVAEKAETYRKRSKHLGVKKHVRNPLPCGRGSPWRKKMNGTVERR